MMAAVLACGPAAVLSHRSAAHVWGIRPTVSQTVEVTVPRARRGVPGVTTYRARSLQPQDVAVHDGFPVTSDLHGYEVDAVWESERLVVELDGYEYHRTRAAFERDRARDAALARAGYRVLRFTWRQLAFEPALVARTIARALATGGYLLP